MPSSVVKSFSYDALKHRLRVVFVSGLVYEYKDVPEDVYTAMRAYRSKGTYLNTVIKGNYDFERIE